MKPFPTSTLLWRNTGNAQPPRYWGIHSDGTQACKAESGSFYRYSAPLSPAENNGLITALAGGYAWINVTDEAVEGRWVSRPNHVMQRAAAYQRDDYNATLYQAVNAVDGALSTFTHTTNASASPWIEIDLGGLKEIEPDGIRS
ncbi:MAG: hypothetical protein JXB05_31230 [Myxococcaceae bacterium]|nr:hypothetical protein [Myxococcaceae bacterium]